MKILYYNCFAGISGDMNLGAMLDIGIEQKWLENQLSMLSVDGWTLRARKETKMGISGTKVTVELEQQQHNHRGFNDIKRIIENSGISATAKDRAVAIFHTLALAEAKAHDSTIDAVHFHEVGAVDSIIDIVGAAICIDYLGVDKIIASPIELGGGMVKCAHGILPVPAPATSEMLRNIPVKLGNTDIEATTPTGAAIMATLVDEFIGNCELKIQKIGWGIGHKDGRLPNVLRLVLAEDNESSSYRWLKNTAEQDRPFLIEANIDDMSGELLAPLLDKLINAGAFDVWITPVIMKKSRPAAVLSVLTDEQYFSQCCALILKESSSWGLRYQRKDRYKLATEKRKVETSYGSISVKQAKAIDKYKPELDDCLKLAEKNNISINKLQQKIIGEIENGKRNE